MKKLLALFFSLVLITVLSGCGGAEIPEPTPSPVPVDSLTLSFNSFDVNELVFDISQYEEKDIVFKSTVEPAESADSLSVASSDNEVAEIQHSDGDEYKLLLKSAGETTITSACGDVTKSIHIVVTDLPKAEEALILTLDTSSDESTTSEIYTYDDSNLCTTKEIVSTNSDGTSKSSTVNYTYNDSGLMIAAKSTDGSSVKNEYDEQGNQTFYQLSYPGGSQKSYYEYDADGNMTRRKFYLDSIFLGDTTYFYDEEGLMVQEKRVTFPEQEQEMISESVYTYNEEGQLTKKTETSSITSISLYGETVTVTDRYYDDNGWFVREEELGDFDDYPKVTEYEYDVYGNLLSETVTDPNDDEKSYSRVEYDYDEYGNCIEERTYTDESATEPKSVTKRTWRMVTVQ